MCQTHISANGNSSAAGNDLYHQCVFGSPSFLEQYEINDLGSAMASVLSELEKERKSLRDKIAKTAILETVTHFSFFGICGCVFYILISTLTKQKTSHPVTLLVFSVLLAAILLLLKPLRRANQEERMQEKKVDAIYQVLGRLQEEQIWQQIRKK